MKVVILFVVLTLSLSCSAQERPTTTEDLHNAQNDLTLGHRFTETMLYRNRNVISSYIEIVAQQLLDSFMDSYTELHYIMDDTTEALNEFPQNNPCIDAIRNRWTLQIHRHGQKLSECLWNSFQELSFWNDYLNRVHHTSQATTTLGQNLGVQTMTEFEDFDGDSSISSEINRQFRLMLRRARPYLDQYEEFRSSIIDNEDAIIEQLTRCDRSLAAAFANEAREDMARAQRCIEVNEE